MGGIEGMGDEKQEYVRVSQDYYTSTPDLYETQRKQKEERSKVEGVVKAFHNMGRALSKIGRKMMFWQEKISKNQARGNQVVRDLGKMSKALDEAIKDAKALKSVEENLNKKEKIAEEKFSKKELDTIREEQKSTQKQQAKVRELHSFIQADLKVTGAMRKTLETHFYEKAAAKGKTISLMNTIPEKAKEIEKKLSELDKLLPRSDELPELIKEKPFLRPTNPAQ